MKKSIENHELHFDKEKQVESVLYKKIELYHGNERIKNK